MSISPNQRTCNFSNQFSKAQKKHKIEMGALTKPFPMSNHGALHLL